MSESSRNTVIVPFPQLPVKLDRTLFLEAVHRAHRTHARFIAFSLQVHLPSQYSNKRYGKAMHAPLDYQAIANQTAARRNYDQDILLIDTDRLQL